ncbi:SET domain-containing protein [Perilla frutescens var. frutescens]|nr:SET domain-containing protein [Perilla frutescens var. frutescens]
MNKSTSQVSGSESTSQGEIIWVEGLVPDIDFCNYGNLCTIKLGAFLSKVRKRYLSVMEDWLPWLDHYALNLEQYEVAQQLRNKLTEVVLITSNGAWKLGDFGFAISNDQSSDSARHSIML